MSQLSDEFSWMLNIELICIVPIEIISDGWDYQGHNTCQVQHDNILTKHGTLTGQQLLSQQVCNHAAFFSIAIVQHNYTQNCTLEEKTTVWCLIMTNWTKTDEQQKWNNFPIMSVRHSKQQIISPSLVQYNMTPSQ